MRRKHSSPVSVAVALSLIGVDKRGQPIEVRGIKMRSRLEARFARHLDSNWIRWEYEPRPFFAKGRGYLPDFRVYLDGERPAYVEVKPTVFQAIEAQTRMELVWNDEPDAFLVVVSAEDCRWFGANKGGDWVSWVERWAYR